MYSKVQHGIQESKSSGYESDRHDPERAADHIFDRYGNFFKDCDRTGESEHSLDFLSQEANFEGESDVEMSFPESPGKTESQIQYEELINLANSDPDADIMERIRVWIETYSGSLDHAELLRYMSADAKLYGTNKFLYAFVEYLKEYNPSVLSLWIDDENFSIMELACKNLDIELTRLLLDIESLDKTKCLLAVSYGVFGTQINIRQFENMCRELVLIAEVDPNFCLRASDGSLWSPLHFLVHAGNEKVLKAYCDICAENNKELDFKYAADVQINGIPTRVTPLQMAQQLAKAPLVSILESAEKLASESASKRRSSERSNSTNPIFTEFTRRRVLATKRHATIPGSAAP